MTVEWMDGRQLGTAELLQAKRNLKLHTDVISDHVPGVRAHIRGHRRAWARQGVYIARISW